MTLRNKTERIRETWPPEGVALQEGITPMTDRTLNGADGGDRTVKKNDRLVIAASSVGTVIEWYDFYLYGSLAAIISSQFFSGVNETTGFIFALMAFAAGFAVRPFGAIVFGRMGDLWGRKNTFLVTMLL